MKTQYPESIRPSFPGLSWPDEAAMQAVAQRTGLQVIAATAAAVMNRGVPVRQGDLNSFI